MIKREYIIATIICLVVLFLSNLPFLVGFFFPKQDLYYLGRRVVNSQDTYTYVSFIEQAKQGNILFTNLYTTEPQTSTLVRPSYAFLGIFAGIFNMPSIVAYHIGRVLFSLLFFAILYIFLRQFFHSSFKRLIAFTIVLTSTGLGFLVSPLWGQTSDLWIPESNTFLSLLEAPHFMLSQALMLVAFTFLLWGIEKKSKLFLIFTLIPLVLLGFEHPYNLFVYVGTVFAFVVYLWIFKKGEKSILLLAFGIAVLGCILGNLYQYIETLRNPTLSSWAAESKSPIPFNFLMGYGFLTVFGLIGLEKFLKSRKTQEILIISWLTITFILLYSPVFFQRRMSEGLHIPISILAITGLFITAEFLARLGVAKVQKFIYNGIIFGAIIIISLGSFTDILSDIVDVRYDSTYSYYYYILQDEKDAMEWLKNNTEKNDFILSNWFYGNILPGITGRIIYVGHKAQTKNFGTKIELVNQFLLEKDPKKARKFLKDNHITYIYLGKNDTMLQYGFEPEKKSYLKKVYGQSGAIIYKVK